MGAYRRLYYLRIMHDYFNHEVCRAILCRVTASGTELMRRRGMLFKRMADNEWAVLYDTSASEPDTAADVLSLELQLVDRNFVLYTCWQDFSPDAAYLLNLPSGGGELEATEAIARTEERRRIGSGFCSVKLALTEETLVAARFGTPSCCTLRFHAPEYRWEYIFLPEYGFVSDCGALCLETADGKPRYRFPAFEKVREFDRDVYRTVSEETIPLKEKYGFRLRLSVSTADNRPKRTLMRDVPPPIPGRHLSTGPGLVRQVCCI